MSTILNTEKLSQMLHSKRAGRDLRSTAGEIGDISASTLSRIENGSLPDIESYFKICKWLGVSSDFFLNEYESEQNTVTIVECAIRSDSVLPDELKNSFLSMLNFAYTSLDDLYKKTSSNSDSKP